MKKTSFEQLRNRLVKSCALAMTRSQSSSIDIANLFQGVESICRDLGMENKRLHRRLNRWIARFVRFDQWHLFGWAIIVLVFIYVWISLIDLTRQFRKAMNVVVQQDFGHVRTDRIVVTIIRRWLEAYCGIGATLVFEKR